MTQAQTKIVIQGEDRASDAVRRVDAALAKLEKQTGKANSQAGRLQSSFNDLGKSFGSFGGIDLGKGLGITAAVAAVGSLGRKIVSVTEETRALQASFTAIYGNQAEAERQLERIRKQANLLGQDYQMLAQQTNQWAAAVRGTSLQKDQDKILEGFLTYGAVLQLPEETMGRIVLALSQMASKGKISAEELRQQLGEALPGAFNMLAESMGITTRELDKMLERGEVGLENLVGLSEKLQSDFGDKLPDSVNRLSNEWSRLGNGARDFAVELNNILQLYEGLTGIVGGLAEGVQGLANSLKGLRAAEDGLLSWKDYAGSGPEELARHLENLNSVDYLKGRREILVDDAQSAILRNTKDAAVQAIDAIDKRINDLLAAQGIRDAQGVRGGWEYLARDQGKIESQADIYYEDREKQQEAERKKLETEAKRAAAQAEREAERQAREGERLAERQARAAYDLQGQVAQLTMPAEEYREFGLERELERLRADLPGAIDLVNQYADAKRASWATEDAKKAADEEKKARDEAERTLETRRQFFNELAALQGNYSAVVESNLEKQVALWREAGIAEADIAAWVAEKRLESSRKALDGMTRAIRDFYDTSTDMGRQMESLTGDILGGLTDSLADSLMEGELRFEEFADTIIRQILRISLQASIANIAKGLLGDGSGGGLLDTILGGVASAAGGALGGALGGGGGEAVSKAVSKPIKAGSAHIGGVAGGLRNVASFPSSLFEHAPRYHRGGLAGLKPGEVPAILKQGEAVFTPEQAATLAPLGAVAQAAGSGGDAPVVNVVIHTDGNSDVRTEETTNESGGRDIDVYIEAKVAESMTRRGGGLNNIMRNNFNATPPLINR